MRFAAIILALLAMILGPISGPASAHAMAGGNGSAAALSATDCHGSHREVGKPGTADDHCKDGSGTCMDAGGCRHAGCMAGGPVPGMVASAKPSAAVDLPITDADRPDGLDVSPALDPPIRRA